VIPTYGTTTGAPLVQLRTSDCAAEPLMAEASAAGRGEPPGRRRRGDGRRATGSVPGPPGDPRDARL